MTVRGPYCKVTLANIDGSVLLDGVDDVEATDVRAETVRLVDVNHANVSLERISAPATGTHRDLDVSVEGSHTSVSLATIAGNASVKTTHGEVTAADVTGTLSVDAEHTSVEATRVGGLAIVTNFDDVKATDVAGPVDVRNEHGGIELCLPSNHTYRFDVPDVEHGDVRIDRSLQQATTDTDALSIVCRTSFDDIVIKPSGPRANAASAKTGD